MSASLARRRVGLITCDVSKQRGMCTPLVLGLQGAEGLVVELPLTSTYFAALPRALLNVVS
jgi:hypothetical protein